MDKDGLLMCAVQAEAFELSGEVTASSSGIFIRRFMNSNIAEALDSGSFLQWNLGAKDILDSVEDEYGISRYGSVKFTKNELHWIGYIYRYYAYTYQITSRRAYKTVKPGELRDLFLPYHTMDPKQAIERILESKGIPSGDDYEIARQYEIIRKVRARRATDPAFDV